MLDLMHGADKPERKRQRKGNEEVKERNKKSYTCIIGLLLFFHFFSNSKISERERTHTLTALMHACECDQRSTLTCYFVAVAAATLANFMHYYILLFFFLHYNCTFLFSF